MEAGMRIANLPYTNKYLLKVLRNNNALSMWTFFKIKEIARNLIPKPKQCGLHVFLN